MSSKQTRAKEQIADVFRRAGVEPIDQPPEHLKFVVRQLRRDIKESSRIYRVSLSNGTGPLLSAEDAELE